MTQKKIIEKNSLETRFLKWQCRARQIAVRENDGRPDQAIMPEIKIDKNKKAIGSIITILNKKSEFSKEPELNHIYAHTHDPLQRREKALKLLCETYYQKNNEFSPTLTATFATESKHVKNIINAKQCILTFNAYNQEFILKCKIKKIKKNEYEYKATIAHNRLFNPNIKPDTIILGFTPVWNQSSANP